EAFEHVEHAPTWRRAAEGEAVDWDAVLDDYRAAVDWPASHFWEQLADANPDALILLSVRSDPDTWWRSCDATILGVMRRDPSPEQRGWHEMASALLEQFSGGDWNDPEAMKAAYERHNANVRANAPR